MFVVRPKEDVINNIEFHAVGVSPRCKLLCLMMSQLSVWFVIVLLDLLREATVSTRNVFFQTYKVLHYWVLHIRLLL